MRSTSSSGVAAPAAPAGQAPSLPTPGRAPVGDVGGQLLIDELLLHLAPLPRHHPAAGPPRAQRIRARPLLHQAAAAAAPVRRRAHHRRRDGRGACCSGAARGAGAELGVCAAQRARRGRGRCVGRAAAVGCRLCCLLRLEWGEPVVAAHPRHLAPHLLPAAAAVAEACAKACLPYLAASPTTPALYKSPSLTCAPGSCRS